MEADIVPLAKRLAEENNVDWRKLEGSGPEGRVVERDVLEYLAQVMTGQEAVNPTKEPLPEGLASWPGGDAPAAAAAVSEPPGREPAFDDGLLDIDDAGGPAGEAPSSLEESDISEDIFLFEPEEEAEDEMKAPDFFGGEEELAAEDEGWALEEPEAAADDASDEALLFGDEPALELEPSEAEAVGLEADTQRIPQHIPLVSYGLLLRRHLDLTTLAEAQLAIGHEFAGGKPLSPTAFLARAAAKALRSAPLAEASSVGLAVISEDGVGVRQLDEAAAGSFLQLVSSVAEAQTSTHTEMDEVALVVADMSEFEVDEAVLNVGAPVLTLGRLLYDSDRGSYRSTLSLSGEFAAEQGAKFLGRVTELLNTPVRLVL